MTNTPFTFDSVQESKELSSFYRGMKIIDKDFDAIFFLEQVLHDSKEFTLCILQYLESEYMRNGQLEIAEKFIRERINIMPNNAMCHMGLASYLFYIKKEFQEALSVMDKAIFLAENDENLVIDAYTQKINMYIAIKDKFSTENYLRKLIDYVPKTNSINCNYDKNFVKSALLIGVDSSLINQYLAL